MPWIDIVGAIEADTAYIDGTLVARDVSITLPEVTFKTVTLPAAGEIELPIPTNLDPMEATITKIGVDQGLRSMITPDRKTLEVRWVQRVTGADGSTREQGCRAYLLCYPKTIPGISLEISSATENEITLGVTRYQLFVGGEEYCLVDQLNGIMRFNDTDYAQTMNSLL